MPDYRLYSLNPHSGHIDRVEPLDLPDDETAIAIAEGRAGTVPLELWQEGRKLRRIDGLPQMAAAVRGRA